MLAHRAIPGAQSFLFVLSSQRNEAHLSNLMQLSQLCLYVLIHIVRKYLVGSYPITGTDNCTQNTEVDKQTKWLPPETHMLEEGKRQ